MIVKGGSADVTTYFSMRLLTTGAGATGLTIADFDMQYVRSGVAPTAKVDAVALAATDTAHTDGRGIEIDAADQPGLYRFDWPDAAFTAGVREAILSIKHASCFTEHLRVEIDPFGAPAGASLAADVAAIKTQTAAIETDTQDLQTQVGTAGAGLTAADDAVLTQIALVKAKTDSLTFTVAGKTDANITHVAGVAIDGVGTEADPFGPV